MREIVHLQAGQCGNQIGAKVRSTMMAVYVSTNYMLKHSPVYYVSADNSIEKLAYMCCFEYLIKLVFHLVEMLISFCFHSPGPLLSNQKDAYYTRVGDFIVSYYLYLMIPYDDSDRRIQLVPP